MKIAVSSTGKEITSKVDPRFGRASFLVVVDTATMQVVQVIDNQQAQDAAHGAGINAATMVAEAGVDGVLSGRVGPKAEKVLQGAGITIYNDAQGTVQEAVEKISAAPPGQPGSQTPDQCAPGQGRGGGPGQGKGRGRGRGCGCGHGRGQGGRA